MINKVKKFTATLLVLILLISCTGQVFAANSEQSNAQNLGIDYFEEEITENIILDSASYEYSYYYDSIGNKTIAITNESSKLTDIISFDKLTGKLYLNGDILGYTETIQDTLEDRSLYLFEFKQVGSPYSVKVTWAKATTAAIVAAAIAAVAAFAIGGVAGVIAAIGLTSLSILAAQCTGGTFYSTLYFNNNPFNPMYQNIWSFKASTGDYYGPFYHTWNA